MALNSLIGALANLLARDPTVRALTAGRVYPGRVPRRQGAMTLPYLQLWLVATGPAQDTFPGSPPQQDATVQVDARAMSEEDVASLKAAVAAAVLPPGPWPSRTPLAWAGGGELECWDLGGPTLWESADDPLADRPMRAVMQYRFEVEGSP